MSDTTVAPKVEPRKTRKLPKCVIPAESGPVEGAVRIRDLPIYGPDPLAGFSFVEDKPNVIQEAVKDIRLAMKDASSGLKDTVNNPSSSFKYASDGASKMVDFYKYITTDRENYAKAMAITVGGMAGFIYASRRGGYFRRAWYTAAGLGTMAAFCYPQATMREGINGWHWVKGQYEDFVASPPPVPAPEPKSYAPVDESKDKDLYTRRSS